MVNRLYNETLKDGRRSCKGHYFSQEKKNIKSLLELEMRLFIQDILGAGSKPIRLWIVSVLDLAPPALFASSAPAVHSVDPCLSGLVHTICSYKKH